MLKWSAFGRTAVAKAIFVLSLPQAFRWNPWSKGYATVLSGKRLNPVIQKRNSLEDSVTVGCYVHFVTYTCGFQCATILETTVQVRRQIPISTSVTHLLLLPSTGVPVVCVCGTVVRAIVEHWTFSDRRSTKMY
jgi:hypothetical protein